MSGNFGSADIEQCRRLGHRFVIAGSDKTPLKKSLICRDCTAQTSDKTVYVAYGIDTESWGEWRPLRVKTESLPEDSEVT